ncbi:MAG TPA: porin [Chitinophagales bacterium]|nr:porin [Chitinophagales bacterium]
MKKIIIASLILLSATAFAQSNSTNPPFSFGGYIETYYSCDFGKPSNHNRPGFIYSHNRHNEVSLNLGLVKAAYQTEKLRANFTLMAGTYPNANLSAEPGVLKNIYEASAGFKISKNKNIWLDAGVLSSHIGFESAIGKDNWTLTRSLNAENTPYFETGAKITYTSDDGKWLISGLVLNGWQRMQRIDGNNTPAFGHQLVYKPNAKITLNSSSFIGSDKPDSIRQMRYFHNLYGIFQLTDKIGITAGFDIGAAQTSKKSSENNIWYNPVIILKVSPHSQHSISLRGEYYNDENGVIIATGTPNGFKTFGLSANYDYLIRENLMWRVEARSFSSKDEIFMLDEKANKNNYFLTTAIAISF